MYIHNNYDIKHEVQIQREKNICLYSFYTESAKFRYKMY